jgi:hypothetical protein
MASFIAATAFASYPTINDQENTLIYDDAARVNYPCNYGGKLLVIYSAPLTNTQPISSQTTLYPIYVKNGYQASPLSIEPSEQTDKTSFKDLVIKTTNPAYGVVSYRLSRTDGQPFYIDTVNFPSLDIPHENVGKKVKYVSSMRLYANDEQQPFVTTFTPLVEDWFIQDTALLAYHDLKKLMVNEASWNQRGEWTDGELGRHTYPIKYRFSPEENDVGTYNGYGFWVCGGKKADASMKAVDANNHSGKERVISN